MKDLVKFNNQKLVAKKIGDDVFVAIKPICDALGIDSKAQKQRIGRHKIMSKYTCIIQVNRHNSETSKDGCIIHPNRHNSETSLVTSVTEVNIQDYFALNLKYLNGWLMSIETGKIKDIQKRELLEKYQEECYDVLYTHFLKKSKPALNNSIVRLQGIAFRKDFTDKVEKLRERLKEQGSVNRLKFAHSEMTNLTYKLALGKSAKELKLEMGLDRKDNVKARLNDDEQRKVQVAEQFVGYLIDLSDYDYNKLKMQINVMPQLKAVKHKELAA